MASAARMDERIANALKVLKSEGHIDDQFEQLLLLQDDSDPDFVKSVMQLFFEVSTAV
jgi:histidine-containing phosphotransfer peotein